MTAPTASTAAPTGSAAVTPAEYASGDAYEPLALKTLASTATPRTPPTSRIAFVAPEALPASLGATDPSTALAAGANTSAMPVPASTNGTISAEYAVVGSVTIRSHVIAIEWSARPLAISGRDPMRSLRMPAIGATKIGIAVHGSVRSPASSGEYPCAVWKNCASRKIDPNAPKNIANDTPLVAANARERKSRIGSIGAAARSSHATNAA